MVIHTFEILNQLKSVASNQKEPESALLVSVGEGRAGTNDALMILFKASGYRLLGLMFNRFAGARLPVQTVCGEAYLMVFWCLFEPGVLICL